MMKKIDWLIVTRKNYYYYWFIDTAKEWTKELGSAPTNFEQRYVRIANKKQKEQALLLLALGLPKYEIERILDESNIPS